MPHLPFALFMALVVSLALALVGNRPLRERLSATAYFLTCCAVTLLAGSWLMYWIHG